MADEFNWKQFLTEERDVTQLQQEGAIFHPITGEPVMPDMQQTPLVSQDVQPNDEGPNARYDSMAKHEY
jgi:hypothetical protein